MKTSSKSLGVASLLLLCSTLAAGAMALNYWYKLESLEKDYQSALAELEDYTVSIDLLVDYGNGTRVWYNHTRVRLGGTLLEATMEVCRVDSQVSEWGVFVTSINGVEQGHGAYWMWSILGDGWELGPVGADQYKLREGDVVAWVLTEFG